MIDKQEAERRVLDFLCRSYPRLAEQLVILNDKTVEKPYGWIVFYNSRRYMESGKLRDALIGNGPFLVEKRDGTLHGFGTSRPLKDYIEHYEEELALRTQSSRDADGA